MPRPRRRKHPPVAKVSDSSFHCCACEQSRRRRRCVRASIVRDVLPKSARPDGAGQLVADPGKHVGPGAAFCKRKTRRGVAMRSPVRPRRPISVRRLSAPRYCPRQQRRSRDYRVFCCTARSISCVGKHELYVVADQRAYQIRRAVVLGGRIRK